MKLSPEQLELLIKKDPKLAASLLDLLEAKLGSEPPYMRALFPAQKRFAMDRARKKTALCSRRAGKSEAIAAWLLEGAEATPGEMSLYVALSRNNARMIMWRTIEALQRRHTPHLDRLKFREKDNQLIIETPGKHQIWLAGCKDSAEVEKFRGMKYKRAAIDEAASFGSWLGDLVYDVLEPALMDLKGELALTGTPGAIPAGLFYVSTTGDGGPLWPMHHWTVLDNPYVPHAKEERDRKMLENKWDENHPTYRREWLGEWVRDDNALVYPFDERNICSSLPATEEKWRYILGIDVGFNDASAFVVGAYQKGQPELYIIQAEKHEGLNPSALAVHVEKLKRKYKLTDIIIDSGGLGKGYAEELQRKYGIVCTPAQKTKKRAYIELVRGELMSGNIKINPYTAGCLLDEMQVLTWNEDRSKTDDRFEEHACDAFLYLTRAVNNTYKPLTEHEPLTHEEKMIDIAFRHKQAAMEQVRKFLNSKIGRKTVFDRIANPTTKKDY